MFLAVFALGEKLNFLSVLCSYMNLTITISCTHKHFGTIMCAVYVSKDCYFSFPVYLVLYARLAGMAGLAVLSVCLS